MKNKKGVQFADKIADRITEILLVGALVWFTLAGGEPNITALFAVIVLLYLKK